MKHKIRQITPKSITTTDNPVFELKQDYTAMLKTEDGMEGVKLMKGDKIRLLGCRLDDTGLSPFRFGTDQTIIVDNSVVAYTDLGGAIGERFKEQYQK